MDNIYFTISSSCLGESPSEDLQLGPMTTPYIVLMLVLDQSQSAS